MILEWHKIMSASDAQRIQQGWPVPYLRLTRSSLGKGIDWQSWFRHNLFENLKWKDSIYGDEPVETTTIKMHTIVDDIEWGELEFTLTHGEFRAMRNNAPCTWLHWPVELLNYLRENDMTGSPVLITRKNSMYTIEIIGEAIEHETTGQID